MLSPGVAKDRDGGCTAKVSKKTSKKNPADRFTYN
jgi:hypothetical protein